MITKIAVCDFCGKTSKVEDLIYIQNNVCICDKCANKYVDSLKVISNTTTEESKNDYVKSEPYPQEWETVSKPMFILPLCIILIAIGVCLI